MKKILILILFVFLNTHAFADKKFEKDLKKISKDSAFVDHEGKVYSDDKITNKEETILIIYTHDKDNYNSPKDYLKFKNTSEVRFVNISSSKCKKKVTLGGYHGLALTKCFADEDLRSKEIIKYLEEIF